MISISWVDIASINPTQVGETRQNVGWHEFRLQRIEFKSNMEHTRSSKIPIETTLTNTNYPDRRYKKYSTLAWFRLLTQNEFLSGLFNQVWCIFTFLYRFTEFKAVKTILLPLTKDVRLYGQSRGIQNIHQSRCQLGILETTHAQIYRTKTAFACNKRCIWVKSNVIRVNECSVSFKKTLDFKLYCYKWKTRIAYLNNLITFSVSVFDHM